MRYHPKCRSPNHKCLEKYRFSNLASQSESRVETGTRLSSFDDLSFIQSLILWEKHASYHSEVCLKCITCFIWIGEVSITVNLLAFCGKTLCLQAKVSGCLCNKLWCVCVHWVGYHGPTCDKQMHNAIFYFSSS